MCTETIKSTMPVIITDNMLNGITYNGAEPKEGVTVDGVNYIMKHQKKDWNNVYSEYVGSNVIAALGGNVHQTTLAQYNSEIVVLCRDFSSDYAELRSLQELNESSIDTDIGEHEYFFSDVLYEISKITNCDTEQFEKQFLQMYVFDSLLGNPDRHMGNWGICKVNGMHVMAPIFDNGACLYPRSCYCDISDDWLLTRIVEFPNSKIMFGNKRERSSYYKVWRGNLLPEYAREFANSLDIKCAMDFIKDEPFLSKVQKRFYMNVVLNRYNVLFRGEEKCICR